MPKSNNRSRSSRNDDWGVTELVRERPIAAAAAAAGAAAAGLFLWSRRQRISNQLSNLSEQIGEWTDNLGDDTAGLTTSGSSSRGMSQTGGGSTGRRSGGGGNRSSASGRSRAGAAHTSEMS